MEKRSQRAYVAREGTDTSTYSDCVDSIMYVRLEVKEGKLRRGLEKDA